MEFLEEETRPRFLFQSRHSSSHTQIPSPSSSLLNPSSIISFSFSILLFSISIFSIQSEPSKSLLQWLSLSLLLGPFAPPSITGGNVSVGVGKIIPDPVAELSESENNPRRSKNRNGRNPGLESDKDSILGELEKNPGSRSGKDSILGGLEKNPGSGNGKDSILGGNESRVSKEREWSDGDLEMLKKLMLKNPVGKPKRWEVISEAFGGGHGVESVIKMAKSMGERKVSDSDSFAKFLKDRKAVDQRVEDEVKEVMSSWSGGDDVALLNALKAFPKETNMRWEKIAAAVPGKTKAACVKRVAELKKDFRTSKNSE